MSYFTIMPLNLFKENTLQTFDVPSMLHGATTDSVPEDSGRILWRIDNNNGEWVLTMITDCKPAMGHLIRQFGFDRREKNYQTEDYSIVLNNIKEGDTFNFRLIANPTKKPIDGKRCALSDIQEEKEWLMKRAEQNGFDLKLFDFNVIEKKWYSFKKQHDNPNKVSILSVTYEGKLTVTDAELFKNALISGIGREKAYGMGLLTVVPA